MTTKIPDEFVSGAGQTIEVDFLYLDLIATGMFSLIDSVIFLTTFPLQAASLLA